MAKSPKARRSLAEIIGPVDRPDPTIAAEAAIHDPAATRMPAPAPGGEGGVPMTFFVTKADRRRLKGYCAELEESFNTLAHEAFNKLLRSRGLPELEPQTANRGTPSTSGYGGRSRRGPQ